MINSSVGKCPDSSVELAAMKHVQIFSFTTLLNGI